MARDTTIVEGFQDIGRGKEGVAILKQRAGMPDHLTIRLMDAEMMPNIAEGIPRTRVQAHVRVQHQSLGFAHTHVLTDQAASGPSLKASQMFICVRGEWHEIVVTVHTPTALRAVELTSGFDQWPDGVDHVIITHEIPPTEHDPGYWQLHVYWYHRPTSN